MHRWFSCGSLGSQHHLKLMQSFRGRSLEVTFKKKKKNVNILYIALDRFQKSADLLKVCKWVRKSKFHQTSHHHMPQCPFPLISALCLKGAITVYYTYLHFMTHPTTCPHHFHPAPLKPTLTVIENTQVCYISFLSSTECYAQHS